MIFEELDVRRALGKLLCELEVMAPENNGKIDKDFYDNLFWQAQVFSLLDPEAWVGVRQEKVIRQGLAEKLRKLKQNLEQVMSIERSARHRDMLKKMITNIEAVDSNNGFLTETIIKISKLNGD